MNDRLEEPKTDEQEAAAMKDEVLESPLAQIVHLFEGICSLHVKFSAEVEIDQVGSGQRVDDRTEPLPRDEKLHSQ